jgi:hypothetical protein
MLLLNDVHSGENKLKHQVNCVDDYQGLLPLPM